MRYALLIALREYLENAKTKGFWIGIFMFPLIICVGIGISAWLARAEPSRHFVVVDQSGAFLESIEQSLARAGSPSRPFVRVALPEEIDAGASSTEILAALRPYLTGDRPLSVDGREVPLFAALLNEARTRILSIW